MLLAAVIQFILLSPVSIDIYECVNNKTDDNRVLHRYYGAEGKQVTVWGISCHYA